MPDMMLVTALLCLGKARFGLYQGTMRLAMSVVSSATSASHPQPSRLKCLVRQAHYHHRVDESGRCVCQSGASMLHGHKSMARNAAKAAPYTRSSSCSGPTRPLFRSQPSLASMAAP